MFHHSDVDAQGVEGAVDDVGLAHLSKGRVVTQEAACEVNEGGGGEGREDRAEDLSSVPSGRAEAI